MKKIKGLVTTNSLRLIGTTLTGQSEADQHPDPAHLGKQLKQTLENYSSIPKSLELFFWLYAFNIFTAICETIVRIPLDLTISSINTVRLLFNAPRIRHTALYAVTMTVGGFIITRDWELFDLSYLYHSFRGQSSVKLYGAGLALEIGQKLLTMAGISLLSKLNTINKHKDSSFQFFSLSFAPVSILIGLFYTLLHFFCLYLDFTLYTIVLNSQGKNMLMYFFVVNLGKMKAATFKKFQAKNFRKSVIFDAKDRFLKITHSIMFILTAWERVDQTTIFQIVLVFFYCSLIDHLRHFSSLAMAGKHNEVEMIYKEAVSSFSVRDNKVEKCMEWDFTVIPFILYLYKFFSIAVWTNKLESENQDWLMSKIYLSLLLFSCVLAPFGHQWIHRTTEETQRER